MSDADALRIWYWSLAAAGGVVVIAASLLVVIWRTALAIEGLAGSALETARDIVDTTTPIWELHAVKGTTAELLTCCESVERRGASLATALTARSAAADAPAEGSEYPRFADGDTGGGENP